MEIISLPVKGYVNMGNPYGENLPQKVRFYATLRDIPKTLTEWMSTNPREQNLTSAVAKSISESIGQDSKDFYLKNRGILLSAKEVHFSPAQNDSSCGTLDITFEDPALHGNVDGGHTLRLILASQDEENLPEQYVEFEVMVGLKNLLPIAEARNTSVALDMKSMEEMKGSFDVLKSILSNSEIRGDRFFDRVELKMNQQLEERNHIDIRMLISVLLMFNQDLFPIGFKVSDNETSPVKMYGNKEAALMKYLSLGDGDPEKRNVSIEKMAPIMEDILNLWDIIEHELPLVKEKAYSRLPFVERARSSVSTFSNDPLKYAVPQSIMFPLVAAYRAFVQMDDDGNYSWIENPLDAWTATKGDMTATLLDSLKTFKNNPTVPAKKSGYWHQFFQITMLYRYRSLLN